MAKKNPLAQGLELTTSRAANDPTPAAPEPAAVVAKGKRAPSRVDRVLIGGFFAPEVQRALKIAAAEEGTTIQALLTEAIDTVFAKRGKPQIASLSASKSA
jgi:hypothetical protein